MNRKIIRIILASLLAAVLVFSTGMMIYEQIQYQITVADADEAARIAGLQAGPESQQPETEPPEETEPPVETAPLTEAPPEETAPTVEETPEPPPPEPLPEEALELAEIDLDALRAVNKDVVGWISIPGTIVSYPLMQGKDNQYYLKHNWKKKSSGGGSVFLECQCSPDLTDFNTIVYAHRMRNETMFGTIKYYNKESYWRKHPSLYVVMDDAIYRYDVFAAYEAAVNGIVYALDYEDYRLKEQFVRYCLKNSVLDTGLTPSADDQFITLSTCTSDLNDDYRWVVHGVLAYTYSRNDIGKAA